MIETTTETLIDLREAGRSLPPSRNGRPVTPQCVARWILHGCPGPGGERVRLEAVRCGSRWLTSREALARFMERLTPRLDGASAPAPRTPGQRQRASERAAQELEEIGI